MSNNSDMNLQEQEFLAKYPDIGNKANKILQKRLNKNVKYFDSGDYNVAKDKVLKQKLQTSMPHSISNNDSISYSGSLNSTENIDSKLRTSNTESSINTMEAFEVNEMLKQATGDTIPTPENVPAVVRKKSLLHQTSHLSRSDSHSFEPDNKSNQY